MPASRANAASKYADVGLSSAGFMTTLFPHASGAAIFQVPSISGWFQGVMAATTPAGRYAVKAWNSRPIG